MHHCSRLIRLLFISDRYYYAYLYSYNEPIGRTSIRGEGTSCTYLTYISKDTFLPINDATMEDQLTKLPLETLEKQLSQFITLIEKFNEIFLAEMKPWAKPTEDLNDTEFDGTVLRVSELHQRFTKVIIVHICNLQRSDTGELSYYKELVLALY
jgi:hypothetical protein